MSSCPSRKPHRDQAIPLLRFDDGIKETCRHFADGPCVDSCIAAKQTLFDHFVRAGETLTLGPLLHGP
jgi:hypothetical protein